MTKRTKQDLLKYFNERTDSFFKKLDQGYRKESLNDFALYEGDLMKGAILFLLSNGQIDYDDMDKLWNLVDTSYEGKMFTAIENRKEVI